MERWGRECANRDALWPRPGGDERVPLEIVTVWRGGRGSGGGFILAAAQAVSDVFRVPLVRDIERRLGHARRGRIRLAALGTDLDVLKAMLVHIEDKEFYLHNGVSLKGLARLSLCLVGLHRRSGGSTITQQLARSLLIGVHRNLAARKVVEILLALWMDARFSKQEQIEMYLVSVRFERGVYGVANAMAHFWGRGRPRLGAPEAFFLVERLSNVRSRLLPGKIDQTLRGTVRAGLLTPDEARDVIRLYAEAERRGLFRDPFGLALRGLQSAWRGA